VEQERPLLIGSPRSGSTLLTRVPGSDPDVSGGLARKLRTACDVLPR